MALSSFRHCRDVLSSSSPFYNAPAMRAWGGTALQLVAANGYARIEVQLLKAGADVNAPPARHEGRTALEGTAEWARIDMVKLLFEAGIMIDDQGKRYFGNALWLAEQKKYHTH